MAQPAFPTRSAYTGRIPDRSAPSSSQPQFGQSAPGFGRQPQFTQPQFQQPQVHQPVYGPILQYPAAAGVGTARGQGQGQGQAGINRSGTGEANAMVELNEEQRDEIREAFSIFDLDKDQRLDFHELRVAFRALGFDLDKPELMQMMSANGIPKLGAQPTPHAGRAQSVVHPSLMLMPQESFERLAARKIADRDPIEEVNRAFYLFDADKKDYINIDDLKRVTRELGENNLDEQELMMMIDEFDYDGIGGISKDAFFSICMQ